MVVGGDVVVGTVVVAGDEDVGMVVDSKGNSIVNHITATPILLVIAFVFWFIMDSLISLFSGFPYNIILNIGFFAGGIWSLSIAVEN